MKRKLLSLLLAVLMLGCVFAGCDAGEIAGSVADAAKAELEKQVQAVLAEYKMDIIELKTTVGKLNDEGGSVQFFCAVLVRAENDAVPQSCADALGKIFEASGVTLQTGSAVKNTYLVNKDLSYSYTSFSDGSTYYTIYAYSSVVPDDLLSTAGK